MATSRVTKTTRLRKSVAAGNISAGLLTSTVLTPSQKKMIATLLATRSAKSVRTAVDLMKAQNASSKDWALAFNESVLSSLIDAWDSDVWEQVTAAVKTHPRLIKEFKELSQKRFANMGSTQQLEFLTAALTSLTPRLSPVIEGLMPSKNTALQLNGLTSLSGAAAEVLGRFRADVSLGGLTNLSDADAELLSRFKGNLGLYGLTELGNSRGHRLLLRKVIRCRDLQLPSVERISDAAAAILSGQRGKLYLDGLKTLSDAAARSFSKHRGSLSLNGLTKLSEATAIGLGRNSGDLSLCGLDSISDTATLALSMNRGWLRLDSIASLSSTAALHLSKHRGHTLELGSLRTLSDAAAKSLSGFRGRHLRLGALAELSDAAMESLSVLLKEGRDRLQVNPALRSRIWLAGNRVEQALTEKDVLRRKKEFELRGADLKEYCSVTDEAARLLGSLNLFWCDLSNLVEVSDQALKHLAGIEGIELSPAIRARTKVSRISMPQLKKLGFMKYADRKTPDWRTLSWGGKGLGSAYQVTDKAGVSYSVGRLFGADAEELVERGPVWFFSSDVSHFGVDASGVEDLTTDKFREWHYRGQSYAISGKGIAESAYERAAFALVAILNQMLKDIGSEERAFGINEGNAFGVAILTESLGKLLARVTDEEDTPVPEKILKQKAQAAMTRGEPPLVRKRT